MSHTQPMYPPSTSISSHALESSHRTYVVIFGHTPKNDDGSGDTFAPDLVTKESSFGRHLCPECGMMDLWFDSN